MILSPADVAWARGCARRMARRFPHADLADLESDALVGLWQAAQRYDPAVGVQFRTFAKHRVGGEMVDGVRRRFGRDTPKTYGRVVEDLDVVLIDGFEGQTVDALSVRRELARLPLTKAERRLLGHMLQGDIAADVCRRYGMSDGNVSHMLRQIRERHGDKLRERLVVR